MLEALLEKFIINYLGRYFSGLDKKKIDIGVWKGDVTIENVALNHNLFDTESMPIEVFFSHIGKISLKVPWTKLSSSSVELTIEDLFLLVRIKSREEWNGIKFNTLDCKFKILKKFAETICEKFAVRDVKPASKSGPPGNVEKLLIKIIDNLQITIKNIHVKAECADSPVFSAGVYLANLKIMTVDSNFNNQIYQKFESSNEGRVVRKLTRVSSFQIYWESKPKELWHNLGTDLTYAKFKSFNLNDMENYKIISLTADLRLTINEKGGFYLENSISQYVLEIDVPFLDIKFTTSQIKDMLTFLASLDNYKAKMAFGLEEINYSIFRPTERIKSAKSQEAKQIIRKWWNYAARAAVHREKLRMGRISTHIPDKKTRLVHEHTIKALFQKVFNKKYDLKILTKSELSLFEEIVRGYSIGTLKDWVQFVVIRETAGKQQQAQKDKPPEEDIFFLRRFLSVNSETGFKESEIKALEKTILKSFHSDSTEVVNKQIELIKENIPQIVNENLVKFKFALKFRKGSVFLINDTTTAAPQKNSEIQYLYKQRQNSLNDLAFQPPSYTLAYEGMEAEISSGTEKIEINYRLQSFAFKAAVRGIDINIVSVNAKKRDDPFLLFYMDQPVRRNSAPIALNLGIGSVHFIYYPFVIYEFQNLLNLDSSEEKGKNLAMRQLRNIGAKSKTKVEEYIQSPPEIVLDIYIESPRITVPFPLWRETYLAETISEMLVLNLGDLRISNHETSRATVQKEMERFATISPQYAMSIKSNKEFEEINISLSSINLVYYPRSIGEASNLSSSLNNLAFRGALMNLEKEKFQEGFTIIENFSLNINVSKLKSNHSSGQNHPEIKVSGKIYDLSINLSAKTYELLLLLAQRENDSKAKGFMKEQKARIMEKATLVGYLNYQAASSKSWKKHFVVLSGPYLYFYDNENELKSTFNINIQSIKIGPSSDITKVVNTFTIVNASGKYHFQCADSSQMTKWIGEIKVRSFEFSPAFEESFEEKAKPAQTGIKKVLTVISMEVNCFKVTFKDLMNANWMVLSLHNIYFLIEDTIKELNIRLKLEAIDLCEAQGVFYNKNLKSLIKSYSGGPNNSNLIDVQIVSQKEKKPEGGNIENLVNFKFGTLIVNWKPKVIQELMAFFKNASSSASKSRENSTPSITDKHQKNFVDFSDALGTQGVDEEESQENVTLLMNFSAQRMTVYLEFETLYLASLDVIDYQMNIRLTDNQLDVQGGLSQFKIYDLTRYPHTRTSGKDYEMFYPEEIFTTNKNESAVKFSFLDFSKESKLNNLNKRKKLLNLDFSSFNLLYFQQPTLRLITYFLDSILAVLLQESPTRTVTEAMTTLDSPSFTEMRVTINRPKIRLKPVPSFKHYYEIDLGYIVLTNTHYKTASRVIASSVEEVWAEKYLIRFSEMALLTVYGNETQQVSEYFDLKMEVERMIFTTEYSTLYRNSTFDKGIHIKGNFKPIILSLSKLNYLLLLSMLFSNIIFEDGADSYFVIPPKIGAVQTPPTTVNIELDLDSLDILLLDNNNWPLMSLGIIHTSILITRDIKKEICVKFKGDKLFGNYYAVNVVKGIIHEYAYISHAVSAKEYYVPKQLLGEDKKIQNIWKTYAEIFGTIKSLSMLRGSTTTNEQEANKFEMSINLKNFEKNIQIEFSRLKLLFNLKLAKIGAEFFGYSEKIQLVSAPKDKDKIRKGIPQLNVNIQFTECLVLLSSQGDINTIALKGKFGFMYVRNSYEESELYQKSPLKASGIQEKEILSTKILNDDKDDQQTEIDEKVTSKWLFDADQMEIIMGSLPDLIQLPGTRNNLTSIFLPFNIFITSENSIMKNTGTATEALSYLSRSLKKFNFQFAHIRVTYKDFMNLIKIFQYQWSSYSEFADTINSKANALVFPSELPSLMRDASITETPFQQTEFDFQGIHLVLINDVFGAHSPLIDFNIKNSEFIMLKCGKTTLTSSLSLSLNFFNPFIGRWEPIVEPVTLYLELYQTDFMSIEIELGQNQNFTPLHINISQEMITIVNRDLKLCMEEYKKISKLEEIESLTETDEENVMAHRMPNVDYNRNDTSPEKMPNFFGSSISDKMPRVGLESDIYSPYAIFNRIGQSCYVEPEYENPEDGSTLKSPTYHCMNGKLCGIYLENKTDFYVATLGSGNDFRQFSQKIRLEIPLKLSYSFIINNIELNQVSQKRYTLVYQNPITVKEETYELLSFVELVGTKRILTLSSVNRIINSTNFKLVLKVSNSEKQLEEFLDSDSEFYIPFTFTSFNISVKIDKTQEWSVPIMNQQLNQASGVQEFRLGNQFFIIRKDTSVTQMNAFVIEPPFILRNFLPLTLSLELFDKNSIGKSQSLPSTFTLIENEVLQLYNFKSSCTLGARIRLESLMVSESVVLNSNKEQPLEKVILRDFAKQSCLINVYTVGEPNGCRTLYFYADLYIKNQTPYNLIFEYKADGQLMKFARQGDKMEKLREQINSKVILGQTERQYQQIYISLKEDSSIKTEKISTQSIGGNSVAAQNRDTFLRQSGAAEAEGKLACYEFGVEINMVDHLSSVEEDRKYFIFSKVITVSPRYVIVNKTPYSIYLSQPRTMFSSPFIVDPNERIPFFWKNSFLKKKVKILLVEPYKQTKSPEWKWSGSLELSTIGNQHFLCVKANKDEVRFLRATTIIEKSILYTVIEEQTDASKLGYRVINDYPDCSIRFHQDNTKDGKKMYNFQINGSQQTGFSWEKPLLNKEVKFYVKFKNSQYDVLTVKCQPDKVNTVQTFTIRSNGRALNSKISLKVFMDGNTKVMRFYPFTRQEEETPKKEVQKFSLALNLSAVGISLISSIDNVRKEVLFAGIKNFQFMWLESTENRTFHTRIKHLQIDNNSSLHAQYPVLLTPYNKIVNEKAETQTCFLDALVTLSIKDKKSWLFPSVKLELSKPVLKIEDSFIDMIIKMSKSFQNGVTSTMTGIQYRHSKKPLNVASPPRHFVRPSLGNYTEYPWEKFIIETNTTSVYVEDFGLSFIEVVFSFKMSFDPFAKSDFSVTKLVSGALGVALTNIENAPIRLKGLEMKGVLDSPNRFIQKLGKHYKQELIKSVFYLLGSVEILGNPIGLFNHITTGMIDFIEKPKEGFIRGPLEGGMGIIQGTGSLVRNTLVGTMGTVNKITGSVAAGISTLSLDQEFIKKRESLRKKRAMDVVDGLGQGLYSIYNGFEQGVVGLFTKPFEEASRTGFTGFLKGSYMALSGVLVKPMTGLLDAASKTAEGFKNMATFNDEGILSIKNRVPRAFYGKQKMYKNYMPYDAEMVFILAQTNEVDMERYSYIDSYPLKSAPEAPAILNLIIFGEAVGVFSHKTSKFIWVADYDLIDRVEHVGVFINFFFKREISKLNITTYAVPNIHIKVNELIVGQIKNFMKKI